MAEDTKLTIIGHLGELRGRLVKSAIAVVITTGISFYFARYIFELFKSRLEGQDFIFIEVTEMLSDSDVDVVFDSHDNPGQEAD